MKNITNRIDELKKKIDNVNSFLIKNEQERTKLNINKFKYEEELYKLQKELKDKNEVIITDHAILRFLERTKSINLLEVKNKILSDNVKKAIETLGSGKFPIDDVVLVVKDKVIVTVLKGN